MWPYPDGSESDPEERTVRMQESRMGTRDVKSDPPDMVWPLHV